MADHAHNLRARSWSQDGPVGVPTRGTTGFNRLRKADRWLAHHPAVRAAFDAASSSGRRPLAVDVGYGASHTTTVEWAGWLRRVDPKVRVLGLEIEPSRVLPPRDGVEFALGGFELAGHRAELVRAFNVLRQYDVSEVLAAWQMMIAGLSPGGQIIEGTCDEVGRRAAWVLLDESGPQTLTLAWDPADVDKPSDVAERLPKALIHENTEGHKIFALLQAADAAWDRAAGYAPYGPRVRWRFAREDLLSQLPAELAKLNPRRRMQDNLLTVPWELVSDIRI
ncbi:class I SAM-dependent methyltransferase [Corynebacterium urealyticum]|uniref:class I SAM-dependent methyltransferase n=1 Tax=Corynebacterium urealyticum TaxID=43771 RepID=UPI001910017B|nr:class I SAM-dependent methyltransferase [Corynebacterium urealyticum]QQE50934.1 class I SAM-dependent methyltransferase [Corynebacterium urealyticum]